LRSWAAAAVVGPLLVVGVVGCVDRGEARTLRAQDAITETAVASQGVYALGTSLNREGAVARDAVSESFGRGGEVFLSIDVRSASADSTIGVIWHGPAGVVLHRESRDVPKSAHYVAFSAPTTHWPRGECTAAVVIDGRVVAQLPFTVV
jgi:hypothetical protein